jgi:hypothetical protein
MAAKTPDSVLIESLGSLKLTIATFSSNDIDDGDTWTSKIAGIVGYWGNLTDDGTQAKEGIDITLTTAATGVLTFNVGEDNRTGVIYVLSKSM